MYAFQNCRLLTSITIPPNINSITFGTYSFMKDVGEPVIAYYSQNFILPELDVNYFDSNSYLRFIPEGTTLVTAKSQIEGLPNGSKIITYNTGPTGPSGTTDLPPKMVKGVIYTVLKPDPNDNDIIHISNTTTIIIIVITILIRDTTKSLMMTVII